MRLDFALVISFSVAAQVTIILTGNSSSFPEEASSSLTVRSLGSDIAVACPCRSHWHGPTIFLSLVSAARLTCNKDIFIILKSICRHKAMESLVS